jgi:hypothetical protein
MRRPGAQSSQQQKSDRGLGQPGCCAAACGLCSAAASGLPELSPSHGGCGILLVLKDVC